MAFKMNEKEEKVAEQFIVLLNDEIKKYFMSNIGRSPPTNWVSFAFVSRTTKEEIDNKTCTFCIRVDFEEFDAYVHLVQTTTKVTGFYTFADLCSESSKIKDWKNEILSEVDSVMRRVREEIGDALRKKEREFGL